MDFVADKHGENKNLVAHLMGSSGFFLIYLLSSALFNLELMWVDSHQFFSIANCYCALRESAI